VIPHDAPLPRVDLRTITERRAGESSLARHLNQFFVVGVPALTATLLGCRFLASIDRRRIETPLRRTFSAPPRRQPPIDGGPWRRSLAVLSDVQNWQDLAYAVLRPIPAIAGFCVALTWWVGAPAGLLSPIRSRPGSMQGYSIGEELFGRGSVGSIWANFAVGLIFLVTIVPVVRISALVDASVARVLLRAVDSPCPA
jgi:hypothetical protein